MTRIVLPGMKERRRGAIVNIGSAAATVAPSGPLYCVYAGTKVISQTAVVPTTRGCRSQCWQTCPALHFRSPTVLHSAQERCLTGALCLGQGVMQNPSAAMDGWVCAKLPALLNKVSCSDGWVSRENLTAPLLMAYLCKMQGNDG